MTGVRLLEDGKMANGWWSSGWSWSGRRATIKWNQRYKTREMTTLLNGLIWAASGLERDGSSDRAKFFDCLPSSTWRIFRLKIWLMFRSCDWRLLTRKGYPSTRPSDWDQAREHGAWVGSVCSRSWFAGWDLSFWDPIKIRAEQQAIGVT